MLIAREKEIALLTEAYNNQESDFIAIYGRRRVGKTYLIRETFGEKIVFQHAGLERGNQAEQIEYFSSSLKRAGLRDFVNPSTWLEAFELLKDFIEQSKEKRKVIFIDELSWMDSGNGKLIMALEGFWNGWASARKDIVLIVCASAASWMMNNIIHNKGGLYNRLTYQIHLHPFSLAECEKYLKSKKIVLNRHQILEAYMIMGGVPYYWSLMKKGLSLEQNIDNIFFAKEAPLSQEFDYLYSSLFKSPDQYISIVTALAISKIGLRREDILSKTKISDSGDFTNKLQNLENCDFIRSYKGYGKIKKDTIYQLIDNYTLFYFKFIKKGVSDEHFWSNNSRMPLINSWCGLAFERVCLEHIPQMKMALGISGVATETLSMYCKANPDSGLKGSQIDLMIIRKDQVINLCEMKYSVSEYALTKKDAESIRNKINDLIMSTNTKYAIHPTLVTTYGLDTNIHSGDIQAVITEDDLFT